MPTLDNGLQANREKTNKGLQRVIQFIARKIKYATAKHSDGT